MYLCLHFYLPVLSVASTFCVIFHLHLFLQLSKKCFVFTFISANVLKYIPQYDNIRLMINSRLFEKLKKYENNEGTFNAVIT